MSQETIERPVDTTQEAPSPKEPKGSCILLHVCDFCKKRGRLLAFIESELKKTAAILGLSEEDLKKHAVIACETGEYQRVAYYAQKEIADAKFSQLERVGCFIFGGCFSFVLAE